LGEAAGCRQQAAGGRQQEEKYCCLHIETKLLPAAYRLS